MPLQLKMKLSSKTGTGEVSYRFDAVIGPENEPWSKWTPSGSLSFVVTNPEYAPLEEGVYLVTLEPTETLADK